MSVLETREFPQETHETIAEKNYAELLDDSRSLAIEIGVDQHTYVTTFELLEKLRQFDEQTARESLQTLPLALKTAQAIHDVFPDAEVDLAAIWSSSLLHDIGKIEVSQDLIAKSNEGTDWGLKDHTQIIPHAWLGGQIARQYGLSDTIARAIEEHHHKQDSVLAYGVDEELSDSERITRDCLTTADFTDAMLTRTNTRNEHLSYGERLEAVWNHICFVFNDYNSRDYLATTVYKNLALAT
ncbi:MAG: HDIG domain-containing protein [Candidatus Saccharibacteria bacterium]|nr:HDIG domain-containing protein [Candidatus Saccharibacteria bacterium]